MTENSQIEWTDHTFNPWVGCSKVGPACDHCYAESWAKRSALVKWEGARRRTSVANWRGPAKWNKAAEAAQKPATVFCLSLGDIWDKEAKPEWRFDLFQQVESTPWLIWLFLSKRIGNSQRMCQEIGYKQLPRNVALGATMVNQPEWDRDSGKLQRAARQLGTLFTFASIEPMLMPIDIRRNTPSWVICGGESGHGARHMQQEWAEDLRDQCAEQNIAFFMKQMTKKAPIPAGLLVRQLPFAA